MPAIGLRSRFFGIILIVLLVVTTGAVYLYSVFALQERRTLIDQQVRETATAIVDSELGEIRKIDFERAEEIISEELGESQIGKFFIIRNSRGETIFESKNAALLSLDDISRDTQWFEKSVNDQFIRGLNLRIPRIPDRLLQVGVVVDESLVRPSYFSRTSLIFIVVVLMLGLVVSFLLTSFLLQPIAQLEKFLSELTVSSRRQVLLPKVPTTISAAPDAHSGDEFNRLIANLNALIEKVNRNYQFSRLWAYQMAHELKTPLSLIVVELEKLQKRTGLASTDLLDIRSEIENISHTVGSFLSWAELENSSQKRRIFFNHLATTVDETVKRLKIDHGRVEVLATSDPVILCNTQHLEQMIQNLLQNALVHSEGSVIVRIENRSLLIDDGGPGIPADVLERLGEPFNRGDSSRGSSKGHGLGLAWIKSVCRLYDWDIEFQRLAGGSRVRVSFPEGEPPDDEISIATVN
jgi:signal transduction histidine kinase